MKPPRYRQKAQAAIEYLLLLGIATAVALYSFKVLLPRMQRQTDEVFNEAVSFLVEDPPPLRRTALYP